MYLGFDPDALDTGPIQTSDMLQYKANVQFSPFLVQRLRVKPNQLNRKLFTRTATQNIGNGDLKTYDLGLFYVATDMTTAGVTLGTIKLCYTIELFDSQPRADSYIGSSAYYFGNTVRTFNSLEYNSAPVIVPNVASSNTLTFKAGGIWYLNWENSTTTTIGTATVTGGVSISSTTSNTGGSSVSVIYIILVSSPGTFTLPANGASTSMLVKIA
jgi:hypothetical protein